LSFTLYTQSVLYIAKVNCVKKHFSFISLTYIYPDHYSLVDLSLAVWSI